MNFKMILHEYNNIIIILKYENIFRVKIVFSVNKSK